MREGGSRIVFSEASRVDAVTTEVAVISTKTFQPQPQPVDFKSAFSPHHTENTDWETLDSVREYQLMP